MNPLAKKFDIRPNQFAILFETSRGIEADDLGAFLRRAASLARQRGVELRVVRFEPGSLVTVFEAIGKATKKEFFKAPVDTTLKATGIVGAVAGAFVFAFNIDESGATPIAKAGACVIEEKEVTKIRLITQEDTVLLMDEGIARRVRQVEQKQKEVPKQLKHDGYRLIADQARVGSLTGEVIEVRGELHFRPDGYRFLVPINMNQSLDGSYVKPDTYFRVSGEISMRKGRPDSIVIHSLSEI